MTKVVQSIEDEPLAVVRALAIRWHVERLRPLDRDVLSMLHGIGCARLTAGRVAKRLGISPREVWRIHDAAIQELGLLAVLEAAA